MKSQLLQWNYISHFLLKSIGLFTQSIYIEYFTFSAPSALVNPKDLFPQWTVRRTGVLVGSQLAMVYPPSNYGNRLAFIKEYSLLK